MSSPGTSSAEREDELERVVDSPLLVEREVTDVRAERTGVDGTDHLAHDTGGFAAEEDLGVKARRGRGFCGASRTADSAGLLLLTF